MSYFIFLNNADGVEGTLYKIAENQSDLNNLLIDKSIYKIIEDSQENFNAVKFGTKRAKSYNNNTINYESQINLFNTSNELQQCVDTCKNLIKQFTNNNPNHPLYNQWNNYYNQLNNLNLKNINYPLTISLEQYFNELGQPSLNSLQIP